MLFYLSFLNFLVNIVIYIEQRNLLMIKRWNFRSTADEENSLTSDGLHGFLGKTSARNGVDLEREIEGERELERGRPPFDRICHLVPGSRTFSYRQANQQPTRRFLLRCFSSLCAILGPGSRHRETIVDTPSKTIHVDQKYNASQNKWRNSIDRK